jgi:hypothetical protein
MPTRFAALVAGLTVACALATGCESSPPSGERTSPAASQTPFPSPLPTAPLTACGAPSHPCLALITFRGSVEPLVSDISDITHPRAIGAMGVYGQFRFVNATEVSYLNAQALFRAHLDGSHPTRVSPGSAGVAAYSWSPDGSAVAYLDASAPPSTGVHVLRGSDDRLIATVPQLPIFWNCSTQACTDNSDFQFGFSPDGGTIMWNQFLDQSLRTTFRIWTVQGGDVTPSLGTPSMAVWSSSSLYFHDSRGIEVFRRGAVSRFLPGVSWIKPRASPMGDRIVYGSRDATGLTHVYVVDTASGATRELAAGRTEPAFLTPRFIWYAGERPCIPSDGCGPGVQVVPSGKTYVYDLEDGFETESNITHVDDIWPHAA